MNTVGTSITRKTARPFAESSALEMMAKAETKPWLVAKRVGQQCCAYSYELRVSSSSDRRGEELCRYRVLDRVEAVDERVETGTLQSDRRTTELVLTVRVLLGDRPSVCACLRHVHVAFPVQGALLLYSSNLRSPDRRSWTR